MFDLKEYKNPSVVYRARPFWALNGKLEKEELKKQILCMKQMGFGGAFMHSRTQLKTEYLGDEWMELMEYCVQVLKENGMEAYLYDEDRWPSGTCGGNVTKNPAFRRKALAYIELTNNILPEKTLEVFAVELDDEGKTLKYRRVRSVAEKKEGERVLAFFVQEMLPCGFYNGLTDVDRMCKEATEKYIELTHEKYKSAMGNKFGREIIGVFTDEPHRGAFFHGFDRAEENKEIEIPYTSRLFEEFYKRKGYKLEEHLPVIWFGKASDSFVKETYDYVEVLQQLFCENFAKPYFEWCQNNNLKLMGHILHEDNLAAQTLMSGSMMRYYEYMDYPGIDNLGSENYVYTAPALVSSVAKQLGKEFALDELYGGSGWHMNLADYKRIGDWQAAGGITFRCPHLSWYTMAGEAKRDCPASILHQSAWYKEYRLIEDYFARLAYLMKNGEDTVDIAIINPIESTWGLSNQYIYYGFFQVKCPIYQKIETEYATLYRELRFNGFAADYIDEGLFEKYGSTDGQSFICGRKQYKTIILNGNYHLRSTTLNALKSFMDKGGRVILLGDMPEYLDGVKHDFSSDLQKAEKLPFDMRQLMQRIKNDFVTVSNGNVIVEKRKFGEDTFIFCLNQEKESVKAEIRIKTDKNITVLNLRRGEFKDVNVRKENGFCIIEKKFEAFEEYALYCSDELKVESMKASKWMKYKEFNEFAFELQEDNMLVLDYPKLYIDGEYIMQDFVLNTDRELRTRYGLELRDDHMIQPWFKEKYGLMNNRKQCRVKLEYEFSVEHIPEKLNYMYETADGFILFVNGNQVCTKNSKKSPIDICFTVTEIPCELLKIGSNTLTVEFDFYEKTNVEAGFLCGNFGVKLGKVDTITALPSLLTVGDLQGQGLPYFGGRIKLFAKIENGEYLLKTEDMYLAALIVNGETMAFKPFETEISVSEGMLEMEMILNRHNSFGVCIIDGERMNFVKQGIETIKIFQKEY